MSALAVCHPPGTYLIEDAKTVESVLRLDGRAVVGVERGLRVLELLQVRPGKPLLLSQRRGRGR